MVVGAGLAGLSATLHLLGAGRSVTVLEAAGGPGGRAATETVAGHRVDTGATVLTMPEYIDDALHAVGDQLADRVTLRPMHPAYLAHFADGESIAVHTDPDAMEAEIRRFAGPGDAAGYRRLRTWLTKLYAVQRDRFIGANFDSPTDLLGPQLARLVAIGGFGRLSQAIARFLADQRLQRLFSFQSLYAGVPPQQALAAYAVIAYMDTVAGVWSADGGIGAVADAMASAATQAGATIHYGTAAAALERTGDRVRAVRTATGERIPCDAVVLTPDLPAAYRLLGRTPKRLAPLRWSPSAVLLHASVERQWPLLDHHTIFFGRAWQRTFTEITSTGTPMTDPSLLVTNPGPAGTRRPLSVLAPCPNLAVGRIDWPRIGPAYAEELLSTLESRGLTGLTDGIEVHQLITPADWAARGLAAGTPFSLAHTFRQTGPFRPRNLVRGTANAVLAGCGTTPGVGVPPVVLSGKLAAARIAGPLG